MKMTTCSFSGSTSSLSLTKSETPFMIAYASPGVPSFFDLMVMLFILKIILL